MTGPGSRACPLPAALALALSLMWGCAGETQHPLQGGQRGLTRLEGTVLEAATGLPVEGALVTGPGDVRATTDRSGRFSMALPAAGDRADEGAVLLAEGPDGLRASNRLQGLQWERLEVVLHLR